MDNIIEIAADWFEKYLAVGNTIDDWLRDSKVVNSGRSKFLSDMERETANNMEQFSLEKYLKVLIERWSPGMGEMCVLSARMRIALKVRLWQ